MLRFDGFNTLDDVQERRLQLLSLLNKSLPRIIRHTVELLTAPSRTHSPRIILIVLLVAVGCLDVRIISRDNDRSA
jgi:hypothetical protein